MKQLEFDPRSESSQKAFASWQEMATWSRDFRRAQTGPEPSRPPTLTTQLRSRAPWDLGYVAPTEALLEGIKFYHDYRVSIPNSKTSSTADR